MWKPTLALDYQDTEDCKSKTPIDSTEGCYVRVKVTNRARLRSTAKDCRAYLTNMEKENQRGEFVKTVYCDTIQLAWSCQKCGEEYRAIDIPKGINQYVDVISTQKSSQEFKPKIMVVPNRYQGLMKETGVFRFTIQVSAEGSDSVAIQLVFKWEGVWDNFEVHRQAPP
jgi:hypothetical protein